jgi:hypothetical protein
MIQEKNDLKEFDVLPQFVLPISGSSCDWILKNERPSNVFLDAQNPPALVVVPYSVSSTPPIKTTSPMRTHIRLVPGANGSNQNSRVFDESELPKHAFAGISVHPKKHQTQISFTDGESSSRSRSHSPGNDLSKHD